MQSASRLSPLFFIAVTGGCRWSHRHCGRAGSAARAAAKDTFFFIPHTHWEGAVFKTREEYLDMGLPNILRALALLKTHPDYRFVLDQACYVKPFLERYPEEAAPVAQVRRGGPPGDRRRHGRDAGRQHAGRRVVRAAGALRQGLLPPQRWAWT